MTLVENATETKDNLRIGYSVESKYWVESDEDGDDALVFRLTTMVPVDDLKDGNIVQSYVQLLYGQKEDSGRTLD